VDLLGFKEGVFPGVFLLSLWRWSGFAVDVVVLFGPGLMASAGVKSGCCNNCRTAPQILGRPIRTVLREAHGRLWTTAVNSLVCCTFLAIYNLYHRMLWPRIKAFLVEYGAFCARF
jgi:hypothetical protein